MDILINNLDILYKVIFLVMAGLAIRLTLSSTNQNWVKTYSHSTGYLILPVVGYIIATVIAGNIALSLGMIGALSIVRFRHPVKNSLELIIFFCLLTLGVATSVELIWAILLLVVVIAILIFIPLLNKFLKLLNYNFYSASFNEGIEYNTIEITSNKEIPDLKYNKSCKNFIFSKEESTYLYRLAFKNREELTKFHDSIKNNQNVMNSSINFLD